MRYLLDTSALLAHYRKEIGGQEVQALFQDKEAEILLASLSLTEFSRRLHEIGADDAEIMLILDSYRLLLNDIIAIDGPIATVAYQIGRQASTQLPLADALIAAAAHVDDAVLVHRDKHMSGIPSEVVKQRFLVSQPPGEEGETTDHEA